MNALAADTFYHQIYTKGEDVAYCPTCGSELVVDNPYEYDIICGLCGECHEIVYGPEIVWKIADKDGDHNPTPEGQQYHAAFIVQQGQGPWTNIKYRTFLKGTVEEFDKLQHLIRGLKPLTAANMIQILEEAQR